MDSKTKSIYLWNMIGSMCNALSSVVLLMIVTRTLDRTQADIFSIGYAIAQLMLTVATFQVRVYQSTDVKEQYSFTQYLLLRVVSCLFMIVFSIGYIALKGYTDEKAVIVFVLCIFRVVDAGSDVYEGLFQQHERLDLAGQVVTLRVVASMIAFWFVLFLSHRLVLGCLGITVIAAVTTAVFCHKKRKLFVQAIGFSQFKGKDLRASMEIAWKCLPIFINGFVITLIYNVPKNTIDTAINQGIMPNGTLTIYNILFMPAFVINLLFIFFRPQITRMAIYLSEYKKKEFSMTIVRLSVYIGGFTVLLCIGGYICGTQILGIVYGVDLVKYKIELVILLLAGAISTLAALCDNVLTILRKQQFTMVAYGISMLITYLVAGKMVLNYGIMGASLTFIFSMLALFIVAFLIMIYEIHKAFKK